MKLYSKLFHLVRWIFIPIILALIVLSVILLETQRLNIGLLTLVKNHPSKDIQYKNGEMVKGDVVSGNFIALDNFLGILSVRFDNLYRINDDWLEFRIKERGSSQWYYKNLYKVDQFQPRELFTFGFPVIVNSKDRQYQFEIESLYGKHNNAIAVFDKYPIFETRYKYPKGVVFGSLIESIEFIYKKINYFGLRYFKVSLPSLSGKFTYDLAEYPSESNPDFVSKKIINSLDNANNIYPKVDIKNPLSTMFDFFQGKIINLLDDLEIKRLIIFYSSALLIYIIWQLIDGISLKRSYFLVLLPILLMFFEVFILFRPYDLVFLTVIASWSFFVWYYKLNYKFSLYLSTFFVILCLFATIATKYELVERMATWIFILYLFGMIQHIFHEFRFKTDTIIKK